VTRVRRRAPAQIRRTHYPASSTNVAAGAAGADKNDEWLASRTAIWVLLFGVGFVDHAILQRRTNRVVLRALNIGARPEWYLLKPNL